VPQDKAQATRLFRQYDIGEAAALYRLAIAGGNVDAYLSLGLCFEKGRGVPLDGAEAERLYQLAARSGSAHALTRGFIALLDQVVEDPSPAMTPAALLDLTCYAVNGLNLAARLGTALQQSISRCSPGGET
jgi:TPR repeat protein